jgi:anaerobic ribonucleoside-triphosphate reductase activating protein
MEALRGWLPEAQGVTISGGEPFDQPRALKTLLTDLRREVDADIFVFSGYSFGRISEQVASMTGLIDALMTDPFDQAAPQTLALRGSDNQRLHLLTPQGRKRFSSYERRMSKIDHRFDVMVDEDGSVWLAGIPRRADFQRLRSGLRSAGHRTAMSDDRRSEGPRGVRRK